MYFLSRTIYRIILLTILAIMFQAGTGYCETCQEFQQYVQQQFDTIYSPKYTDGYCKVTLETTPNKKNIWQDCDYRSLVIKEIIYYCGDRVITSWDGGISTQYSLREKHEYCDGHITDGEITYSCSCNCPSTWFCGGNLCGGVLDIRDIRSSADCSKNVTHNLLVSYNIPNNLKISTLSETSTIFNPSSDGSVGVSGTITECTDQAIYWTATVAGRTFSGTGASPSFLWDGKDNNGRIVLSGTYQIMVSATTADGKSSDSKSIPITVISSCDLTATLTGPGKDLPLGTGSSFQISGSYSTSSSDPVNWALTLPDGSITNGTGIPGSATWNGNNANGTLATAGTYSAVFTVTSSTDSTCAATSTLPITVTQPPDQCGLYVDFGSTAHMANGNLSHSQELFSSRGGALPAGLTLYYNSLDPHNGSLGRGWSHSYNVSLKENDDGSVLISDGNWRHKYYSLSESGYAGQPGNYATLEEVMGPDENYVFTLTYKDGQVNTFNDDGTLAAIRDRNGNTTTLAYYDGRLDTVTDPSGRVVSFAYDSANHMTSVTDPAGNYYAFSVGTSLNSVTQTDSGIWQYTYDTNGFMLSKSDPVGNAINYAYDDQHRVIASTDPEGRMRNIAYPRTSDTVKTTKTTSFTEKNGGVWNYSYDTQKGYLLSKTDPQGGTTSYAYDTNGNRTATTNPDGTSTSASYDSTGNMLTSTDAMGQTTGYTYNTFGQVTGIADAQGGTTSYTYDAKGNMTALTDPAGGITKYEYDSKGNITNVTDAAGQTTSFTYDLKGNLATVTDSSGATTSYTYDNAGNVTTITNARGDITRFVYDARNRLIKSIDPNGNASQYSYDANGNKLSETDANGNVTRFEYNAQNQLIKTIDALGNVTTYAYGGSACPSCGGGNGEKLTSLIDANGNLTSYTYDQLGRLEKESDPKGNETAYAYDAKGNLTSKTDANGNTINYSYDGNGRLIKKSYPDNTEESFTYDPKGNILSAVNNNITYSFSYDAVGRMQSSTDSNGKVLRYSYDNTGRKTKTIYPEGSVVSYAYDGTGRQSSITNGGGKIYSYSYDKLGRRTKLAYPSGASANYAYDVKGNLTSLIHKTSTGKIIDSFSYTHDKVGNRLTKAEPDLSWNYGYDSVYRLLQALPQKPQHGRNVINDEHHEHNLHMAEKYAYDPVGNRLTGPWKHATYNYGLGNELLASRHTEYVYDKNGNQITRSQHGKRDEDHGDDDDHNDGKNWTYIYDFENRLIKAEKRHEHEHEKTVVSFKYDPLDRRIEKKITKQEDRESETTTHAYVYDDQAIILEYETKTDDGRTKTKTTKYVHGPGIDEPLSLQRDNEVYYYHADGLGSVVALTDKKQKTVETYEYDSFGNLKQKDKNPMQPFTYTGREWDKETGLYYYRARYYDPMEGRFISKDPIAILGNIYNNAYNITEDQRVKSIVNPYAYTDNNPINYTDPTGLASWHFDYSALRERLIHYGKFRFNSAGELVEHTGRVIKDIPCEAAKALEWLKKVKPDFFRAGPVFLLLPGQKEMLDNFNKTGSFENDGSEI